MSEHIHQLQRICDDTEYYGNRKIGKIVEECKNCGALRIIIFRAWRVKQKWIMP